MKTLLIVGGVLFLLLAFVLFIAAIVAFVMIRKRQSAAAATPVAPPVVSPAAPVASASPAAAAPAPAAPPPAPGPAPPAPAPAALHDGDATVMDAPRRALIWGALHATSGPLAGRVFPIDANGFFIGRDRSVSQVVIDSPSISKRHVWVGIRDGAVTAVDQNSTNGTFLNDPNAAITETRLSPGDTLILGGDVARFTYSA
jgi:FHA domain.